MKTEGWDEPAGCIAYNISTGREGEIAFRHSWSTFTTGLGTLDLGGSKNTSRVTARWGVTFHTFGGGKEKARKPQEGYTAIGW